MESQTTQNISDPEQAVGSTPLPPATGLSIARVGDTLICSGSVPMIIPTGGAHVRVVEIRLPLFAQRPNVTATVHSPDSLARVFGIYKIQVSKINAPADQQTRIVITAGNTQVGVNVPYTFFCDFVVIGKAA